MVPPKPDANGNYHYTVTVHVVTQMPETVEAFPDFVAMANTDDFTAKVAKVTPVSGESYNS